MTARPAFTVMPDFGMGPYLWFTGSSHDLHPLSDDLHRALARWVAQFESAACKSFTRNPRRTRSAATMSAVKCSTTAPCSLYRPPAQRSAGSRPGIYRLTRELLDAVACGRIPWRSADAQRPIPY